MDTEELFVQRLSYARRLKNYRKLCGVKAYVFAELLGVDQPEYSKKENGYANIREDQIEKAKKYFQEWRSKEVVRLQERIKMLNEVI